MLTPGECPKYGHSPHRFGMLRNSIMEVGVRRTKELRYQEYHWPRLFSVYLKKSQMPGAKRQPFQNGYKIIA